jgi:hypothetical protein
MERGQTVGQWVATPMYSWRFRFKNYRDIKEQKERIPHNQWLLGYVQLFTENVRKITVCIRSIKG